EGPAGRGEVPVGHVDGDALLALGPQSIGEQSQVRVLVAAGRADRLHRGELVLEDRLGVVEQPPDQGGLAVVDRAGGGEAEEVDRTGRGGLRGPTNIVRHLRSTPRAYGPPSPPR